MLVLLTGGDWDPQYESQWRSYAENLKNVPVNMYSYSIGSVPTQAQLQQVIPYIRDIFRVSSYDAMDSRLPDIVNVIRGGDATVMVWVLCQKKSVDLLFLEIGRLLVRLLSTTGVWITSLVSE